MRDIIYRQVVPQFEFKTPDRTNRCRLATKVWQEHLENQVLGDYREVANPGSIVKSQREPQGVSEACVERKLKVRRDLLSALTPQPEPHRPPGDG